MTLLMSLGALMVLLVVLANELIFTLVRVVLEIHSFMLMLHVHCVAKRVGMHMVILRLLLLLSLKHLLLLLLEILHI